MIILESLAALVTICGGIVAALVWIYTRLVALRQENESLRAQLAERDHAPVQPAGREYLVDEGQTPLCIRCYGNGHNRWKLVADHDRLRCPVCDKVVAR